VDAARVRRVHDLIMATTHDAIANDPDTALLIDIDLSILGADPDVFDRFERNVRKEYWWVPGPLFRQTRAKILQSFLDRPSVYATAGFRERLEDAARRNLAAAIAALTKGT
jgi:predicted metal-dependent HD superfamily phosphohydrolase